MASQRKPWHDESVSFAGSPAFGERGRVTHINGRLQCHICGNAFVSLGSHVWQVHGCSANEYRREFGLHREMGLLSDAYHQRVVLNRKHRGFANRRYEPVDAYTVACVVCGCPITMRRPPDRVAPVLCSSRDCLSRHSASWHIDRPQSDITKKKIEVKAKARWSKDAETRLRDARNLETSIMWKAIPLVANGEVWDMNKLAAAMSIGTKHASTVLSILFRRGQVSRVKRGRYQAKTNEQQS